MASEGAHFDELPAPLQRQLYSIFGRSGLATQFLPERSRSTIFIEFRPHLVTATPGQKPVSISIPLGNPRRAKSALAPPGLVDQPLNQIPSRGDLVIKDARVQSLAELLKEASAKFGVNYLYDAKSGGMMVAIAGRFDEATFTTALQELLKPRTFARDANPLDRDRSLRNLFEGPLRESAVWVRENGPFPMDPADCFNGRTFPAADLMRYPEMRKILAERGISPNTPLRLSAGIAIGYITAGAARPDKQGVVFGARSVWIPGG